MTASRKNADRHIVVVGAGPGGLTSAMILAHRGFRVTVVEKAGRVGGRSACLQAGPYIFDTGPTFLHQKFTLEEMFQEAGRNLDEELDLVQLDPMTRLKWGDTSIDTTSDSKKMAAEIERAFPGESEGFQRFMADHEEKLRLLIPCLQSSYGNLRDLFRKRLLDAFPYVVTRDSVFSLLGKYFSDERLRLAFTFQAKYLGMSPWKCPALFSILAFLEYRFGIYHVQGGVSRISEKMAEIAEQEGAEIRLNSCVREVLSEGWETSGVVLESGEVIKADAVVINADYGHAVTRLLNGRNVSGEKLRRKGFSCSTFMLYLGLDTLYRDEPHHQILFADDYRRNVDEIQKERTVSQDMSVYVRNSSVTDPLVAPEGHSNLYILVPTINTRHRIDWPGMQSAYRDKVLDRVEERTGMKDLRRHIVEERMITPRNWQDDGPIFLGATFNLKHTLNQLLYLRPHNRYAKFRNLYLAGGGTHPGSGLPTIYESARISSNLICEQFGSTYEPVDLTSPLLAERP
ncbi:MAG: phytoene desaturase family protein [Roseibacillus sp.]|nr:phytoene desaturase [Roseibacillus sp.]MCP4728793.1 phytoene desaturase [Roseibacillus sp.]MDP7309475.1 phytoene desaturase family protein [Roseibacillus sp.]HJM63404.1 phytoene desaturase family protein [Roseibacillus sp.]